MEIPAAHCVQHKYSGWKLVPDNVRVLLGAYNLLSNENGTILSNVTTIHVHPDWNVHNHKYDANIAILILSEHVNFTNYIRPICMPTNDIIDDATGSIVGLGLMDNGKGPYLEYPRHAVTNVLNASYCLTTYPDLADVSSTRTFCGSVADANSTKGDAGGGFFVQSGYVWVQHGILSTIRVNPTDHADTNSISVYTNVKLFTNWIDEIVYDVKKINLECIFYYING